MLTTTSLKSDIRARRIWYNDIEVGPNVRTRFPEDYDANPVLRTVDAGNCKTLDRLAARLPQDLRGRTVLDLGCADGLFTFWAAQRGAERVIGIERNRYNFARAEWLRSAMSANNVEFVCGSIGRHLPPEPVDYIFCLSLLYHLVDPLGTLYSLRTKCQKSLILVTAIDLLEGDGQPISRLDRYATGAHGIWSFNVPMVRQLLTTAGFEIMSDEFEDRKDGGHYAATCVPGKFESHHIFLETIDQEFPINVERRRDRVRSVWKKLAREVTTPVAIFGAGTHTPWLLEQVRDISGVRVACVLDDRLPPSAVVAGLPVQRPDTVDVREFAAVVLSSWHQTEVLNKRASQVFDRDVRIISLAADATEHGGDN